MKTYSPASDDVLRMIDRVREAYYSPDLDGVTVAALFVYDMEATEPVLTHGGYPAQAVCRITPVRDRALGVADAVIVVDRSNWLMLGVQQREALIDHELQHIERVLDKDTELPKTDAVDRPKIRIRKHDFEIGVFAVIAERHGEASPEVRAFRSLIAATSQMSLDLIAPERRAAA